MQFGTVHWHPENLHLGMQSNRIGLRQTIWHWERESARATSPVRIGPSLPRRTRVPRQAGDRRSVGCTLIPVRDAERARGRCHAVFPHPPDGAPPYAIGRQSPARRRSPRRNLPHARRHAAPILRRVIVNDLCTAFTSVSSI
jgi:hypothetical protein